MVFTITYQALGILASAGTIIYDAPNALASELNITSAPGWSIEQAGWTSANTSKDSWKRFAVSETYLFLQKEKQEPK